MAHVYVSYANLEETKQHGTRQVSSEPESTQETLIIPDESSWKPWKQARSRIRGIAMRLQGVLLSVAGLEWYCFVALGVLTALMSFVMDMTVAKLLRAHQWLYGHLEGHRLLQFLCWTLYPASLCALSTSFSHSICPQSAGSGLPEMRTILSGVQLPDYLSLSNLFAKFVGLICTLSAGSTVFLGKVGPFVHISNMVGAYLYRVYASACGKKQRRTQGEMLVVASAVGVASCFGAPISGELTITTASTDLQILGVLFSLEVMGSHYSLRDYCPCFLAAVCGALTYRLLSVLSRQEETVRAVFKTSFPGEIPYQPPEILIFALLGLLSGAVSCVYLFSHRWILRFVRKNSFISKFIAREKALYSGFVAFLLALVTFPHMTGSVIAARLTMRELLSSLLDSNSWSSISQNDTLELEPHQSLWQEWSPHGFTVYHTLGFFIVIKLGLLVLACTLPLPAGYFMPIFIFGAALGRFVGEGLVYLFPDGISSREKPSQINPGGYALVGAASFAGAVTHTLSPALCALELTGESTHILPLLIAVLCSNALARSRHQPSFYDGISLIKRLPHLPSLIRACPKFSSVQIGPFVGAAGAVLQRGERPAQVQHVLNSSTETKFPIVDTHNCPTLLGTVTRSELQAFLKENQNEDLCKSVEDVCLIQPVKLQISTETTIKEAHCIMSVVRQQRLFVTEKGKLCGIITWIEMKNMIEELAKEV